MNASPAYTRLAGVYDEIVVDPCYAWWAAFLHERWQRDRRGVRDVLDVCCGTGLLAAELIALGYDVRGTDASPSMLERARTLLGPAVDLQVEVLPAIGTSRVFDAVVSTFDGFNYLTPDDLGATLLSVSARLRPGGWLVFDLHTDTLMEFTALNPVVEGDAFNRHFVISSDVDVQARRCDTTIVVTGADETDCFTETHRQYFFSDELVRDLLARAGFDRVEVVDEYSATPAGPDTVRATWIARRPD